MVLGYEDASYNLDSTYTLTLFPEIETIGFISNISEDVFIGKLFIIVGTFMDPRPV